MSVEAAALEEVLARHGVQLTGAEFVSELDEELSRRPVAGATPLSASELAFLAEHGGSAAAEVLSRDADASGREAVRSVGGRIAGSAAATFSIAEAALLLGVDRTRISQRISQRSLWAFPVGRAKRLPRWQFTASGAVLPGLATVVAAIPRGLSPESVAAFMTQPQPELSDRTPSAHLAAGGEPGAVAELLAELGRW